jgi:hypothetical protein
MTYGSTSFICLEGIDANTPDLKNLLLSAACSQTQKQHHSFVNGESELVERNLSVQ